jgi:hypothetical protein
MNSVQIEKISEGIYNAIICGETVTASDERYGKFTDIILFDIIINRDIEIIEFCKNKQSNYIGVGDIEKNFNLIISDLYAQLGHKSFERSLLVSEAAKLHNERNPGRYHFDCYFIYQNEYYTASIVIGGDSNAR